MVLEILVRVKSKMVMELVKSNKERIISGFYASRKSFDVTLYENDIYELNVLIWKNIATEIFRCITQTWNHKHGCDL